MLLKNKNINVTLSLSVALLTIVWLTVLPQKNELESLAQKIKNEKSSLTNLYNQGKNIKELRIQMDYFKKEATKLRGIFLQQNNEIAFITTLEKIASKNNVEQTINLSESGVGESGLDKSILEKLASTNQLEPATNLSESGVGESGLKKSTLNLKISGSFINIINYLEDLENLDYYINIIDLNLNSKKVNLISGIPPLNDMLNEPAAFQKINAEINGNVYWNK